MQFSVVIPTYNRPRQLARCLDSLLALDYAKERFEVIVVDDGSRLPLDSVVEPYRPCLDVTLLRTSNGGPGMARNLGARRAHGRFLAFTDDDCAPNPSWLTNLERAFDERPDAMIGGRTVNRLDHNSFSAASQVIVDAAYDFYNSSPAGAQFFASNNMSVPTGRFIDLQGFDPNFRIASEDRELCDRWRSAGHRLHYAPCAVVYHEHELDLMSFCRQHFRYGRGAAWYHHVRALRGSGRVSDDMGFHARLIPLFKGPLSRLPTQRAVRVCALLGVWQVSNAAGFFYESFRGQFRRWEQDGALP